MTKFAFLTSCHECEVYIVINLFLMAAAHGAVITIHITHFTRIFNDL